MTYQIVAVNDAAPGACVDVGLTWNGSTTLTATQIIAGTAMTMSGTAAITGNTTIGGTLTCAAVDSSGAADFAGNFSVATNKATIAAATGNTAIAGTLAVTGASTFASSVGLGATANAAAHGAVALSVTELFTLVSSDATSDQEATLADGVDGQMKIIKMEADGGNDVVLTPAHFRDGSTITFDAANEIAVLVFGDSTWNLVYTDATVAA